MHKRKSSEKWRTSGLGLTVLMYIYTSYLRDDDQSHLNAFDNQSVSIDAMSQQRLFIIFFIIRRVMTFTIWSTISVLEITEYTTYQMSI